MSHNVLILTFLFGVISATCFYPNGASDSGYFPCDASAATSVCCAKGFQCLSNGLCGDPRYADWERVLRGGCTDKSWGSEKCTSFCKDEWPTGEEAVYYCGNGKYCCDEQDCCSNSSTKMLELGAPEVVAIAGGNITEATGSSTAASSTSPAGTTTTPTSSNISAVDGNNIHKGANTIAIGAGVGVGVGVLLFATLFATIFCIQRKKRKQRQNNKGGGVIGGAKYEAPIRNRWWNWKGGRRSFGGRRSQLVELSPEPVYEMSGHMETKELDGNIIEEIGGRRLGLRREEGMQSV